MKPSLRFALLVVCPAAAHAATPGSLSCESLTDPPGVDVTAPRLSWVLNAGLGERRLEQSAYQVLAASSPGTLERNLGNLWDSGRVKSVQSIGVKYEGKPLQTGQTVYWKVHFWNGAGKLSPWSPTGHWTMGVLRPQDWTAHWIAAPGSEQRQPATLGYHAGETEKQDELKWVQVDLGTAQRIQTVRLDPMLHVNVPGFGFPLRFKVEADTDAGFPHPSLITDQSAVDFANPGVKPVEFNGQGVSARFVRITVTKMVQHPDGKRFAFALRQLEVISGGKNVALDAPVSSKDSVEYSGWGQKGLTDGVLSTGDTPAPKYPTLMLRKEFTVQSGLRRATAFVSGLGQYEMSLNGAKVGDDLLAPGWTNYRKTVLYDTRDITAALKPGTNVVGLLLGNGMYNVEGGRYTKFTGTFGPQKAIAQLRLEYNNGSVQTIGTDGTWRAAPGPLTFSNVYGGEDYDARLAQPGWNRAGFKAEGWKTAPVVAGPGGALRGLSVANPPIRAFETFAPVSDRVLRAGVTVYDMGQNASVMPRLKVQGPAGSVVRIIPGELLNPDGSVSQASGGGPSYWQYTLAGTGEETYFPKFFYRGSRYQQVEVTPAPGSLELPTVESLQTVMVQADAPIAGHFTCSNELFNRIWTLVRWAQRSNTMSIMTDCPHREKLGWIEEDYLNGPALRYNFDMGTVFSKVLNDMADSQTQSGLIPSIAPEYVQFSADDSNPFRNSPEWGSAYLQVAWQQYQFTGDTGILRRHYEGMKRYVDYLTSKSHDHILDFGLGDWYDIGPGAPGFSQLTPRALTATGIYFEDAKILANVAKLLGKAEDGAHYEALTTDIGAAFNAKFFNAEAGIYATGSQTANSFPLALGGLVSTDKVVGVMDAIVKDVAAKGLTSGDVGYRYLLRALADNGHSDVIYAMNNQSEKPGYGYQLKKGATSLTEAWDANPNSSQNHFMLGQINEWFFHDLAGIQPGAPGFSKVIIKPAFVADLTHVAASYKCGYGMIRSEWTRDKGKITLKVSIPGNTTGTVVLPSGKVVEVKSGEYSF